MKTPRRLPEVIALVAITVCWVFGCSGSEPVAPPAATAPPTTQPGAAQLQAAKSRSLSKGCAGTRKVAAKLFAEFDRKLSAADRARAEAVVVDIAKKGRSRADGYNAFAGGALLAGQFQAAAWGALKAAVLEWRPIYVCNVGVSLFYLDRFDDAERFLNCARELAPSSPYALEALALLALKRKDCPTATRLIDQAVRMMPGDVNILYSAGVIHYRCGDIGSARRYLRQAQSRRPGDKTIAEAVKVVDPNGDTAPPPRPDDCLARLVDETIRFLDDTVAEAQALSDFSDRLEKIRGPKRTRGHIDVKGIRSRVENRKKELVTAEKQARELARKDNKHWLGPGYWNVAVGKCISARLSVTNLMLGAYHSNTFHVVLYSDAFGTDPERLLRQAMSETNGNNSERMSLIWQGERRSYEAAEEAVIRRLKERLDACYTKEAGRACLDAAHLAACKEILPAFERIKKVSQANISAAVSGFPAGARNQLLRLSAVTGREADFIRRGLSCMKKLQGEPTKENSYYTPERQSKNAREMYHRIFAWQGDFLKKVLADEKNSLEYAVGNISSYVASKSDGGWVSSNCKRRGFKPKSLGEEWDLVLAALKDAGEYNAGSDPECVLTIGNWSTSVKFFEPTDINLKGSSRPWSVKGKTDLRRWGVDVGISETANSGPVTGKVGVKLWIEDRAGAPRDSGAEFECKLGFGHQEKDVGGLACYLVTTKARVNMRVLADRLRGK